LGTANFTARLTDVEIFPEPNVKTVDSEDYVLINSAIPVDMVKDLKFNKEEYENYNFVEEDMLPGDFIANGNREVRKMNRLLFSITPHPLRVKLNKPYYVLKSKTSELNIQFVDE